jgi:aminoglycoside phosphotransferase (APT) family kinase protein
VNADSENAVPADVEQLLGRAISRWRLLAVRSHDRTGAASVWEVEDPAGHRWFAKRHWRDLLYERETRAYDEFVPSLGVRRAPWLVDRDPAARLIITGGLQGEPLGMVQLTSVQKQDVFRQAGVLAARLHALTAAPAPGSVRDMPSWQQQRAKALDMAMDLGMSAEDVAVLAAASAEPPPPVPAVVCHGDFGPRNWIVHRSGEVRLQLIDFERTTVEDPARHDLMRIVYQVTSGRPALAEAFFDGYGRQLTEAEGAACRAYAALDCPSALKWAADHRDQEINGYACRALDQLRSSLRPSPTTRSHK